MCWLETKSDIFSIKSLYTSLVRVERGFSLSTLFGTPWVPTKIWFFAWEVVWGKFFDNWSAKKGGDGIRWGLCMCGWESGEGWRAECRRGFTGVWFSAESLCAPNSGESALWKQWQQLSVGAGWESGLWALCESSWGSWFLKTTQRWSLKSGTEIQRLGKKVRVVHAWLGECGGMKGRVLQRFCRCWIQCRVPLSMQWLYSD